jgi:hypothetical protein
LGGSRTTVIVEPRAATTRISVKPIGLGLPVERLQGSTARASPSLASADAEDLRTLVFLSLSAARIGSTARASPSSPSASIAAMRTLVSFE